MSRLTAVMTHTINEDSGRDGHAVADTATDVTPASGEAARLAGLQRLRSRGHDVGRETADPCSGLLRSYFEKLAAESTEGTTLAGLFCCWSCSTCIFPCASIFEVKLETREDSATIEV